MKTKSTKKTVTNRKNNTKMPKKSKPVHNKKYLKIIAVVLLFGAVGVYFLFDSFATTRSSKDDHINYIVAISVDGLRPDAITKLGSSKAPNLYRFMRNGVYTLEARNDSNVTVTLPNHTSMLTGRPVTATGGHKVTINGDNGKTVHHFAKKKISSVFDVVHDRGGRTELVATKDKFTFLNRTWNKDHALPDTTGTNNGRDKIDAYYLNENDVAISNFAKRLTTNPARFSFLHIRYPDTAGHKYGWMSKQYMAAVQKSDALVGKVLNASNNNARLRAHAAIILTSDHGGKGKSHSDPRVAANYKVPFMVKGPGIPRGVGLYSLNKNVRKHPGVNRIGYSGLQPIRNSDLGNLATDLLDYPAIPGSIVNNKQNLNVFK